MLAIGDVYLFGGFRLDRRGGGLFREADDGASVPVAAGSRALDLLGVLVERHGDLVSKDEIMDAVWPGTVVEDNNLTVQISALRRILDRGRSEHSCIQTVTGRGYRFVGAVARPGATERETAVERVEEPLLKQRPGRPRGVAASLIACALVVAAIAAFWTSDDRWFGREATPPPRLSIVVRPFTNLSDDREQQYFADGITEDLTTDLSRIAGSFVISRNTAFTYKDKPVSARQIGRELGVRYVLEGSVQRSANRVHVNAQLIATDTDAHLWAERFDRDIGDLFTLQNEITSRIAIALNLALIGAEAARPTANPDALDYILRGRAASNNPPSRAKYAEAIGLFERALSLDPRSVGAQSLLATVLTARVLDQMTDTAAADIARAEELVEHALAAAHQSLSAHYAKGQVLRAQRRYVEAISEYEMVVASNRNAVSAIANLGQCKFYAGSIEEMIPAQEQAIRLSPRDPQISIWYSRIGRVHLLKSRTGEAILWLEKARSGNAALAFVHAWLASAYGLNGETERAASELAAARRLSSDDSYSSIARLRAVGYFGMPKIRALYETTYFAGLRKAGMPEQ